MKVVEVIPVVRGIAKPSLSYFSKDKLSPGNFVRIPMRKGHAMAIVASTTEVKNAKSELKKADFILRKLQAIQNAGALSPAFMKAVSATAEFYAVSSGSVLGALLPKLILESPELLGKASAESGPAREVRLIQLSAHERFREYRSLVRESLARGASAMLVVPTIEEALNARGFLSLGIESYVYSPVNLSTKKMHKVFLEATENPHPILFITTPAYICFERKDLDTFIVERENSRAYRRFSRPFIDIKKFLKFYADARGALLILGDSLLSLESLKKERDGLFAEFTPLTWRLKERSETELVDLRAKKEFEVISERLRKTIDSTLSQGKNVFLFGARKGFSPSTVCSDCGSLLLCKNCSAPMVLHPGTAPQYICHHCGARRSAETRCDNCQSWKLTPLGIGLDRIYEEARKLWPDTKIFQTDKDKSGTPAKARALIKQFLDESGAILIGTELPLTYLESVPLVAAVSLDSLFSIPDFFINERIFYLVTRLREIASERFVLQTRNAGSQILEYAGAGNVLDFYRTEIAEREELAYPPFSIFVKVSVSGSSEQLQKKASELQEIFASFNPQFLIETRKQKQGELSMIMRFARDNWPQENARQKLLLLPSEFLIKVDPESIL